MLQIKVIREATESEIPSAAEPKAVYRYISSEMVVGPNGGEFIQCSDEINDPSATDLLVVFSQVAPTYFNIALLTINGLVDRYIVISTLDLSKFTAPLVRKNYPPLLADKLVSIQPMSPISGNLTDFIRRWARR